MLLRLLWLWPFWVHAFVVVRPVRPIQSRLRAVTTTTTEIGPVVGAGSYGTVHRIDDDRIGKRAWSQHDLEKQKEWPTVQDLQAKVERCRYYWEVERHCAKKLGDHPHLAPYRGTSKDDEGREWLVYDRLKGIDGEVAPSLGDLLELDRLDHRQNEDHHLYILSQHLGTDGLLDTLDVVLEQLLETLAYVHSHKIVHRDLKPTNLLVTNQQRLVLIDFGSAADLATAGIGRRNLGLSERVAISPIYAAPEIFVDASLPRAACAFDCFSLALLYCQLLFQYLDERTDAGFHQQLSRAQWNLDEWLAAELQADVQPQGLDDAFDVLRDRPGLWHLLQRMLTVDPRDRISCEDALEAFRVIRTGQGERRNDGQFLTDLLEASETCEVLPSVRALEFVATFARSESLGLVLAEPDSDVSDLDEASLRLWNEALLQAEAGEVFVKEILPGGQADDMKMFTVGDRLGAVGEIPILRGGFERVVELVRYDSEQIMCFSFRCGSLGSIQLESQPRSSSYVTLHFHRKPRKKESIFRDQEVSLSAPVVVEDQGSWSVVGRRESQEDTFLLHECEGSDTRCILLAGVCDGHLGRAASTFIQKEFPFNFADELMRAPDRDAADLSRQAWESTCNAYRGKCDEALDQCVAEYDPAEGVLVADTGSTDAVAGSTSCIAAVDITQGCITFLNCGDSRALMVDKKSQILFRTTDHKPANEVERFVEGKNNGLEYSVPQCRLFKWYIPVGDYDYGVSRSLEGPFATSKGIVSIPDVTTVVAAPGSSIVVATDGLWEVLDSEVVGRLVAEMRTKGLPADEAAKRVCSSALDRGSFDNVSVVVVYLG